MDTDLSNYRNPLRRQRGMATLIIALIILVSMTIITLYTGGVGVFEQRTSANEVRSEQVLSAAEYGLQEGLAFLEQNTGMIRSTAAGGWMEAGSAEWITCPGDVDDPLHFTVPCGDGVDNIYGANYLRTADVPFTSVPAVAIGSYELYFVTRCVTNAAGNCTGTARPERNPVIDIIARGATADGTGTQLVKVSTHLYPVLVAPPDAPLVASGSVPLSGNFNIVAAPNAGGSGVPVSVWSGDNAATDSGSAATCHLDEFLSSGTIDEIQTDEDGNEIQMCSGCLCDGGGFGALSLGGEENYDILDVDTGLGPGGAHLGTNEDTEDFPPDMFEYVFGVPIGEWESIRAKATVLTEAGCDALDTTASGIYWVEGGGSCDPDSVGSFAKPVMIVLDQTDFGLNAGDYIFGVVFSFHPDAYAGAVDSDLPDITLNGGAQIYGSVLSVGTLKLNGTMRIRYDEQTLTNLRLSDDTAELGPVAGTWADY